MRIRWKLLLLLLAIALLPMVVLTWFENLSLLRMGDELGDQARQALTERAGRQLARLAVDYGAIVRREAETIEVALRAQVREIERSLAGPVPSDVHVLWSRDIDQNLVPVGMLVESGKHVRWAADGSSAPLSVTYERTAFLVAPGVARSAVMDQAARLTQVEPTYQFIQEGHRRLVFWQYVALADGLHSTFPGHGGYPLEYDPRKRDWYMNALQADGPVWGPPVVDAATREVLLSVSMPVRGVGKEVVGVSGMDVRLLDLASPVDVPAAWSEDAVTMIVLPMERPDTGELGIAIMAQRDYIRAERDWNTPIAIEWLDCSDEVLSASLLADLYAHQPGLLSTLHDGEACMWAYAPLGDSNDGAVLLIVPQDDIVVQAKAAESYVLDRTSEHLRLAGVTLAAMIILVTVVALLASRAMTRPIADLANAARRLTHGDFSIRTNIRSRDELGELGRMVNQMIPRLEERIWLRSSLSLAQEVQQRLLPDGPPNIAGLDVAGRSIYCDQTGGDYYDYVELDELGSRQLVVFVGDVTGHGIAAALLMATGRALLRSHSLSGDLSGMMNDVNRHLVRDSDSRRFMTLVCLVVDIEHRRLRWASAGHDAPVVYDPRADEFDELEGSGLPLGIDGSWLYEEFARSAPAAGSVIVLGTDGIWEAHNEAGEMFGAERYREVIRRYAAESAELITSAIVDAVAEFRGSVSQEDDITLVVIKMVS